MSILRQNETAIRRLRVSGEQPDPLNLRLRFERLFSAGDFLPGGLPPEAIICIRYLRDPAPQTLRLQPTDLRFSTVWQNSVKREIEKLFQRAYRPVRESVPAHAESIVFANRSELLACLAADRVRGALVQNWWWRSLFPDLERVRTVAQIWIESAEFAPAAFGILAQKRLAADFVAKLSPAETGGLLRGIIRVFGLSKLSSVLFSRVGASKTDSAGPLVEKTTRERPSEKRDFQTPFRSPWIEFAPETLEVFRFDQKALLGIGLMLVRAPRLGRSAEFARRVEEFQSEIPAAEKPRTDRPAPTVEPAVEIEKIPEKPETFATETAPAEPLPPESKPDAEKVFEQKSPRHTGASKPARKKPLRPTEPGEEPEPELRPAQKKESLKKIRFADSQTEKVLKPAENKKREKPSPSEKPPMRPDVVTETDGETGRELIIETRFGGVFYLLNLGLYLRLYSDFADPLETEIDLNIWDFVALLGREFLGRKIEKDPVWDLLAGLAGRESADDFGGDFDPPDDWRLPPDWLETFQADREWTFLIDEKRLVVQHPAGFRVIDVSRRGDPEAQLETELKDYRKYFTGFGEADRKDLSPDISPLERWRENLTGYSAQRLRRALNFETPEQINRVLLTRKARVAVTDTKLDVTFRLADLPFAIRLSGLDRNPGWIPAAGKYIKFHYI